MKQAWFLCGLFGLISSRIWAFHQQRPSLLIARSSRRHVDDSSHSHWHALAALDQNISARSYPSRTIRFASDNSDSPLESGTGSPEKKDEEEEDGSELKTKDRRRQPLARLIYNFWYVMTAPFPDLRKISRGRNNDNQFSISLRLKDGLAALLAYLGCGVLSYHYIFEKWSIVDSLYFTCVCFSTVGYGDMAPSNLPSKIFTCFFGLTGIALLGAAVATIGSKLVQAEVEAVSKAKKESRKRLFQMYDHMPKIVRKVQQAEPKEKENVMKEASKKLTKIHVPILAKRYSIVLNAARYVAQILGVVAFGGLVVGKFEGWSVIDSFYYSLITASTIGLGDLAPQTRGGRIAAVFVIPMAVAAAGEILASIGMALVERRQKKLFKSQLVKGLSMESLKQMDGNNDGKVSREEYVNFMLMEMGLGEFL